MDWKNNFKGNLKTGFTFEHASDSNWLEKVPVEMGCVWDSEDSI